MLWWQIGVENCLFRITESNINLMIFTTTKRGVIMKRSIMLLSIFVVSIGLFVAGCSSGHAIYTRPVNQTQMNQSQANQTRMNQTQVNQTRMTQSQVNQTQMTQS